MSRPVASLASAAAQLSAAVALGRPAWVSADAWQALTLALWHLRRDIAAVQVERTQTRAGAVLGVSRDTLLEWRRGWLAP